MDASRVLADTVEFLVQNRDEAGLDRRLKKLNRILSKWTFRDGARDVKRLQRVMVRRAVMAQLIQYFEFRKAGAPKAVMNKVTRSLYELEMEYRDLSERS